MKIYYTLCLLLFSMVGFSQSMNDYAYVIVPEKYDFLKSADQYQLNALTKFLFNKYGFEVYMERDEKPFNAREKACKLMYADVEDDSNFINTKVAVLIKDCDGNLIYKTPQGKSKSKDFKAAYHEALRNAFVDIQEFQYVYNGKAVEETHTEEVMEVSEENKEPKENILEQVKPSPVAQLQIIKETNDGRSKKDSPIIFVSEDSFYRALQLGDSITFYEGDKTIGSAKILEKRPFSVKTSQFEGIGHFKKGRLIIERKISGVAGLIEMIFTQQ